MTLGPGSRLGPYEVLSPLGAGGMGEVWRARDAKLGRDVAIKVLPEAFASDAESSQGAPVNVAAVPVAGGTPRSIETGSYETYHPFFSPSGRWVYFQAGHKNLFRVPGPVQGWASAPPQKVTDFSGFDLYIENPRISRDGSKLFYTRGRRTGDIFILHPGTRADRKAAR